MVFADSNRVGLRFIQEGNSTWGVTPASGRTREMRLTSSSLAATKETVISDELRADRMVSSVVEASAASGGDVNFECSAGSQDIFMQAFLLGLWSRPMDYDKFTGIDVSWGATNRLDISGGDFTLTFVVGRRWKTEGFLDANNNDYWEVMSVAYVGGSDTTQITMTASTAVIESGNSAVKAMEANDVVVLKDTTIRAGTAGNSSFDSNSNNAFASAIAAGQLVAHQRVYVEGLGYEEGTIAVSASNATDGDTVTIDDGVNDPVTFEFDDNATTTTGNIVLIIGADQDADALTLRDAINNQRFLGNLDIAATVSTNTVTCRNLNITGGSITEVGDLVVVDFAGDDTTVQGVFTITSATDDELFVTPAPNTDANGGGLAVTFKASMLRNPGALADITPQSFTIETTFNDVGLSILQDGLRVGTYSLDMATGAIVTGTLTFAGRETNKPSITPVLTGGGYDVLNSTTTEVMNATTNVGSLTKNGVVLSTGIQSISLSGDSSLRNQNAISAKFPLGIGTGRFNLTGTITAYFENAERFNHFIDHDTIAVGWDFVDLDVNRYFYDVPSIKITSDPVAPGGIDQDILETLEFVAFRDPATESMIQIDRFSSTNPPTIS